jgi:hypothetical protein
MRVEPTPSVVLLPDAGPLITLAYAQALHVLFKPGWLVSVVDMVQHEVTRNQTPTSNQLAQWVLDHHIPVINTQVFARYQAAANQTPGLRKSHLGELAIQEAMGQFAWEPTPKTGIFLFENHKIARASFVVPDNCRKVSTRAFLLFLEQRGWIDSASAIERQAIQAGRHFSTLRFPP